MTKQSSISISIVPGTQDENQAKAFAELGEMAGQGLFDYMLGTASAPVIQQMYMQPDNELSFQQTHFAYADNAIAGMCNGYSADRRKKIVTSTIRMMMRYAGWRVIRMVWTGIRLRYILGFMKQLPDNTFYIQMVATNPQFRGQGVGRQLLAQAETEAVEHNCHTLALDVDIFNTNAIRVYEHNGFTATNHSPVKKLYGRSLGVQRMVKQVITKS